MSLIIGSAVLFIVLFSGDFCAAFVLHKEFGEVTPAAVLLYGIIVYVCGLAGSLKSGIVIVGIIVATCWLTGLVVSLRNGTAGVGIRSFINAAFLCYLFFFLLFIICDYGQLVTGTDDPGHWLDCVKVLTYNDVFYTDPSTNSSFPTYPPMMALIQFIIQKYYLFISRKTFSEWLMFLTYHMVCLSLFLPFVSGSFRHKTKLESKFRIKSPLSLKNVQYAAAFLLTVCLAVTVFFGGVFFRLMIDPFLACEGAVLFLLVMYEDVPEYSFLYFCILLPATVLTKDMGLLFSIFGLLYFIIIETGQRKHAKVLVAALLVVIGKLSWTMIIRAYHVVDPKPDRVRWGKYFKVLSGFETYSESYKNTCIEAFRTALFTRQISLVSGLVQVSYIQLLLGLVLICICICCLKRDNKRICAGILVSFFCMGVYFIGLGGVYVDKFVKTEAETLASFERYTNTLFCMLLLEILVIVFLECKKHTLHRSLILVSLVVTGLASPLSTTYLYLTRYYPYGEQQERKYTDYISEELKAIGEPGDQVYFISQSNTGTHYLYVKFMLRPELNLQSTAGNNYNWCFVDKADPENMYYKEMHAEDFRKELFGEHKYKWVAIMQCDEYFKSEFKELFAEPGDIMDNSIYQIDYDHDKLVKIT